MHPINKILKMKFFTISVSVMILTFFLFNCSDNKEEVSEPSNNIFAFGSTSEENITISNGGTNAVVNINAFKQTIDIPVTGTFINTKLTVHKLGLKQVFKTKY